MKNKIEQEERRQHKVGIRRGEVIEKVASFKESAFSVVYEKAETIIRDIVREEKTGNRSGHLLAFMGERGSGKTTAMLSFLHALKEKGAGEEVFLADCNVRFTTFDVIDASMLEQDEDLFEIVLAQMLVHFLEHYKGEQLHEDAWGEGRKDTRKEIHKMFNDLLEGFRSLKRQGQGEEVAALVSLKSLSFSSRLKQNFQRLVKEYLACLQEPYYGQEGPKQNYLVFAIDDLDMNIDKGFEMLGQLHRYMLVPQVIILVTAKYEQLETLGRKYFAYMVERLDRPTDEWKIDYLNKTVKEYLEKMLPLYDRLYLPDFENNITGYANDVMLEKESQLLKQAILGKIFRRTGIYFDGVGEKKHYLTPTSMRGLNDYYLFLNELVKLKAPERKSVKASQTQKTLRLNNCDKFLNDFIYRYMVERLEMPERLEFKRLLQKPVSEWYTHMYDFLRNIVSWLKEQKGNQIKENDRIRLEILLEDRKCFGNMLWGIYWCVANMWRPEEWMNCIITLYSVILNKEIEENGRLKVDTFHGSVIGIWSNQIFPPALVKQGVRDEKMVSRFGGSNKGCRNNIDFKWDVEDMPDKENIFVWFRKYKKYILSLEVMTLFMEAFHGNTQKNERVHIQFKTDIVDEGGQATVWIDNKTKDFNILGFLTNLLDYETFYEGFHDALLGSCIVALRADRDIDSGDQTEERKEGKFDLTEEEKEMLRIWKGEVRGMPGLSLYLQTAEWDKEAEGLVLPYQHVDIYANLLAELHQWSKEELPVNLTEKNVWKSLKATILKIEEILQNKGRFLKEIDSDYDNLLSRRFSECPVVQCIKDYRKMGLREDFPEEFGRIFAHCCTINDYTRGGFYPPENEIGTTEEFGMENVTP